MTKIDLSQIYTNVHLTLVSLLKEYVSANHYSYLNRATLWAKIEVLAKCLEITDDELKETVEVYREKWSNSNT